MSGINYRQQWAEGEIEAGMLLDAIDTLAQRCRELEADVVTLGDGLKQAALIGAEAEQERDALRAKVDQIKQIATSPHESKEALAARVRSILEEGQCHADTAGDTITA